MRMFTICWWLHLKSRRHQMQKAADRIKTSMINLGNKNFWGKIIFIPEL
jgi:hypothetical protein